MVRAVSAAPGVVPPWTWPWWRPAPGQYMTLVWVGLIHVTAVVGLFVYPLPGWPLFLATVALAWLGGLGTTVCYHRALAHRALHLHPMVREILIFFALFNGSGAPLSWTARQVDMGWWVIRGLERLGLATDVRRPRAFLSRPAEPAEAICVVPPGEA